MVTIYQTSGESTETMTVTEESSTPQSTSVGLQFSSHTDSFSGYLASFYRAPVTYQGDSIFFDPNLMELGFPYTFKFLEHYMVVIKSVDEAMNFFYIPNSDDAEAK